MINHTFISSNLTQVANANRLSEWFQRQQEYQKDRQGMIYYLLPSKKWLQVARSRQSGLVYGTFDDLSKLILNAENQNFKLISESERLIFMKEIIQKDAKESLNPRELHEVALAHSDTYGQLKRLGTGIDKLPTALRHLLPVFKQYEEQWEKAGLIDPESLLSLAATSIQRILKLPICEVVMDGFTDFNPLQYQIIKSLKDRGIPMTYYLPDIPNQEIIEETKTHFNNLEFNDWLEESKPSRVQVSQRVCCATTLEEEIHGVLDEICEKSQGASFIDFGIVLVNESAYLEKLRRVAKERKVPLQAADKIPIQHNAFFQLLKSELLSRRFDSGKWERLPLLDVLLRLLHVKAEQYSSLKKSFLDQQELPAEIKNMMELVVSWRVSLPDRDTMGHYLQGLQMVLGKLDFPKNWQAGLTTLPDRRLRQLSLDWKVYDYINQFMNQATVSIDKTNLATYEVSFDTFREWLLAELEGKEVFVERAPASGIPLFTLRDAGLFQGKELFVLGMNEDQFPKTYKLKGYLKESDLHSFSFPFAKLDSKTFLKKDEAMFAQLPYLAKYLTFSYVVGIDPENPLLPSKFIRDIANREHKLNIGYRYSENYQVYYHDQDRLQRMAYHLGQGREFVLQSAHPLAGYKDRLDRLDTGVEQPNEQWQQSLKKQKNNQIAITKLESYATCPFKFAMENILQVDKPMEKSDQLDPAARGNLIHFLMKTVYDELGLLKQNFGTAVSSRNLRTEIREKVDQVFSRLWNSLASKSLDLTKERLEYERNHWSQKINTLFEAEFHHFWENESLGNMFIEAFEKKIEHKYSLDDHEEIILTGSVDRIDRDDHQFVIYDYKSGKASMSREKEVKTGLKLQLLIYIMAMEKEWNALAHGATYISLQEPAKRSTNGIWHEKHKPVKKNDNHSSFNLAEKGSYDEKDMGAVALFDKYRLTDLIKELWEGTHTDFSVRPKKCMKYCAYKSICRVTKEQLEDSEV